MTPADSAIPSELLARLPTALRESLVESTSRVLQPLDVALLTWVPGCVADLCEYGRGDFTLLRGGDRRRPEGSREIADALADGWTLQAQHAERGSRELSTLCSHLMRGASYEHTRINLYVTPPGQQSAFGAHHDVLDALILQVTGSKWWRVWPSQVSDPVWKMKASYHGQQPSGEPMIDVVLKPGHMLFVRRGDIHEVLPDPGSTDRAVHFTIGVHSTTGGDVLHALVDEMANEPIFRSAIPHAHSGGHPAAQNWAEGLLKQAASRLGDISGEDALQIARRARSAEARPDSRAMLVPADEGASSWLAVNPTVYWFETSSGFVVGKQEARLGPGPLREAMRVSLQNWSAPQTIDSVATAASVSADVAEHALATLFGMGLVRLC